MSQATEPPSEERPVYRDEPNLMHEITHLFMLSAQRMERDDARPGFWDHGEGPALIEILNHATTMTFHVLHAMGLDQPVNGMTTAKERSIPNGTVSKITRRRLNSPWIAEDSPNQS